jgi:hypothetical protein
MKAMQLIRSRGAGLTAGVAASLVLAHSAVAHHSQSEFDFKQTVIVEGAVTKLDWRSPHARLYLDVVNAAGETEHWDFELPSPTTLMRRGWKRDAMKPGDKVTVNGARARNFPLIGYARTIKDAGGKALFTGITEINEPEKTVAPEPEKPPEKVPDRPK